MSEPVGRLALPLTRLGFADGDRAATLLAGIGIWGAGTGEPTDPSWAPLVADLAAGADPDRAVLALVRLVEAQPVAADPPSARPRVYGSPEARRRPPSAAVPGTEARPGLLDRLRNGPVLRARLTGVLGASTALADHLVAHPEDWRLLDYYAVPAPVGNLASYTSELLLSVGGDPADPPTGTGGTPARGAGPDVLAALRTAYRRRLLVLAGADLAGELDLPDVAAALSDLAAALLVAGHAVALAATGPFPAASECRLAVIGLGKCGGRELNYVSDVDVIFAFAPSEGADEQAAMAAATRVAAALMRVCGDVAWPVDAALRPEGKAGQLVRTLDSHEAYYKRWARTWEFQALLKARPVAGDPSLGAAYVEMITPLVWSAAERPDFVADVQQMRRRVEDHLPAGVGDREVKLGPGGLRDVEFAVQLLQLVHGRADERLRTGNTLAALTSLAAGGYVGLADAASLIDSYTFLRTVEHRLQLQRLRRTHLIPDDPDGLRWLARGMGHRVDPVAAFEADRARHAREVRRLHEKLFYRPLLSAVARMPAAELRLTEEAARSRLVALGFADPEGALRHLSALTSGVSRRAAIQKTLLPVLLERLADAPDPDAGLLAYRQVSDALGDTPWYLRLLRDEGQAAERLATLLGSSRYVADLLMRAPAALRLLADDAYLAPRPADSLMTTLRTAVSRHESPSSAVQAARALRRQELLRTACADLLGLLDVVDVGQALSDVAAATLQAALDVATREIAEQWSAGSVGAEPLPARLAVIAMGRLGGAELSYGSDADVMFVYEPAPGADDRHAAQAAHAVAELMRSLLAAPAPDPPLPVDANLRPEGRGGPLVRSLSSYAEYYRRWSHVWESQALLRASPVAGDLALGARFVELVDPLRYPAGGLPAAAVTEIRRIKARVDAERLPRGADPATHTKLGRGGLADVEWTVQLLQLRHGHLIPSLRTPRTLDALAAAVGAGLLGRDDAAALEAAWRTATRARNAIMLVRGRPGDQLPGPGRDLAAVARAMGYPPDRPAGQVEDDYRRATRRARRVVERIFYEG